MKLFTNHSWWWAILVVATIIVSAVTSREITFGGMAVSVLGHLAFSIVAAGIPWLVYRLAGHPLTTEQMMATISVGWLILAVANIWVMP